jgi:DNA-binding GntR family transcriptional regulator
MMMLKPLNAAFEPNMDEPLQLSIELDRRKPVSDQIYTALRQAIITLELPPSTPISENRICRHIGVSRTPVREAIIRLAEEELIDVFPQQGSFVSAIKVSKIRESHFTRKCLELGILGKVAEHWSPELSTEARKILARQEHALSLDDKELFHFLDEEFHKFFSESVGYRGVWNAIQGAKARVDRLHRLAAIEGRLPIVIEEHRAVIDALDRGDISGATAAMVYHLDRILALLDLIIEHNKEYFAE